MAAAAELTRTHHQRAAEQTARHFDKHPECLHPVIAVDAAGNARRDTKRKVDVDMRCSAGWWLLCRMGKVPDTPGYHYGLRRFGETQRLKDEALYWQFDEDERKVVIEAHIYLKELYEPEIKKPEYRAWWKADYIPDAEREALKKAAQVVQAKPRRHILTPELASRHSLVVMVQ